MADILLRVCKNEGCGERHWSQAKALPAEGCRDPKLKSQQGLVQSSLNHLPLPGLSRGQERTIPTEATSLGIFTQAAKAFRYSNPQA